MSRKVVHDDDVTAVERWSQTLFDVCEEDCPVHRPIDHEGCDHPVVAQSDNQGDGLPMAVRNGPDQSFAPRATAPKSHQAGAGGGLVDKHQSGGIKQRSEEHTSELQSQSNLVCRLLLEKKKLPHCSCFRERIAVLSL